jgi:hypothetical protein
MLAQISIQFVVETQDDQENVVADLLREIITHVENGRTSGGVANNGRRLGQWTLTPIDLDPS